MFDCPIDYIASKLGIRDYTARFCDGCLILQTQSRDFRVQVLDEMDPTVPFEQILRKAFASELQSLGVDCTCVSFVFDGQLFIAEEMVRLKEISSNDCSLDEAIKSASVVTRSVEKSLMFPQIVAQLKQRFGIEKVQDLRIACCAQPQLSDFAIFNELIVPINFANQFLAVIGSSKSWAKNIIADDFIVDTQFGKFIFGPKHTCCDETEVALRLFESVSEWWLFPFEFEESLLRSREIAEQNLQDMHVTNVKIFKSRKLFPVAALSLTVQEESEYI